MEAELHAKGEPGQHLLQRRETDYERFSGCSLKFTFKTLPGFEDVGSKSTVVLRSAVPCRACLLPRPGRGSTVLCIVVLAQLGQGWLLGSLWELLWG